MTSTSTGGRNGCADYLDQVGLSAHLKLALMRVLDNRPADPLRLLAAYFAEACGDQDDPSRRQPLARAYDLVRRADRRHTVASRDNLLESFLVLEQASSVGLRGREFTGLLSLLCRDLQCGMGGLVFARLQKKDFELVGFSEYAANVNAFLLFEELLQCTRRLFEAARRRVRGSHGAAGLGLGLGLGLGPGLGPGGVLPPGIAAGLGDDVILDGAPSGGGGGAGAGAGGGGDDDLGVPVSYVLPLLTDAFSRALEGHGDEDSEAESRGGGGGSRSTPRGGQGHSRTMQQQQRRRAGDATQRVQDLATRLRNVADEAGPVRTVDLNDVLLVVFESTLPSAQYGGGGAADQEHHQIRSMSPPRSDRSSGGIGMMMRTSTGRIRP